MISADAFTAITYGLLALVVVLYLVLLRSFITPREPEQEQDDEDDTRGREARD